MRLLTYRQAGAARLGAAVEERIVDVNRAVAALQRSRGMHNAQALADATAPTDVVKFLGAGEAALATAWQAIEHVAGLDPEEAQRDLLVSPATEIKLLPPVPRPPKIVCVGRNYAKHAAEANLP